MREKIYYREKKKKKWTIKEGKKSSKIATAGKRGNPTSGVPDQRREGKCANRHSKATPFKDRNQKTTRKSDE